MLSKAGHTHVLLTAPGSAAGTEQELPEEALPTLRYNLARCLETGGDHAAAEAGYRGVFASCPTYVDCLLRMGYMQQARCFMVLC